jgi:adenylate cyclase
LPEGERRLAAIMFTDMVGYTALTQSNESQAMEVLERHNRLLRSFFPRFHGREVKTIGDSFLVEFESALDAVRCAAEIQSYLHDYNISSKDEWKIKLRIGIHLGDVIHQAGDVFGDAVNISSRIELIAEPEGVCISEQVYHQVRNKFALALISLGEKSLKNVSAPIEVYRMMMAWERSSQSASLDVRRIAVLPFVNMSPDQADEYFADGMTEELISSISNIGGLSVISRTSAMKFKGGGKTATEIGQELKAGSLLEGSVRKADNFVRVTAQLIDVNTDRHLWSQNYDRELKNIFALQSEIAKQVADALRVKILSPEKERIEKKPTESVEAHNLYLKGVYHVNKGSPSDIEKGIKYFELACEQDPNFALAYAKAAEGYVDIAGESRPSREAFPKAKQFLAEALSLDNGLAEAHFVKAAISCQYDWDWAATERSAKKAISLNSSLVSGHLVYAWFLAIVERFDEAIAEMNRAYELDPVSPFAGWVCAVVNWMAGKNDRTRELCMRILETNPNFARAHMVLALLNAMESRAEEATKEADRMISISDEAYFREHQAQVYALVGLNGKAWEILNGLLAKKFKGFASPMEVGLIYYMLGEKDRGFEWMQKAYQDRDASLPWICRWPTSKSARDDHRFIELLNKIELR